LRSHILAVPIRRRRASQERVRSPHVSGTADLTLSSCLYSAVPESCRLPSVTSSLDLAASLDQPALTPFLWGRTVSGGRLASVTKQTLRLAARSSGDRFTGPCYFKQGRMGCNLAPPRLACKTCLMRSYVTLAANRGRGLSPTETTGCGPRTWPPSLFAERTTNFRTASCRTARKWVVVSEATHTNWVMDGQQGRGSQVLCARTNLMLPPRIRRSLGTKKPSGASLFGRPSPRES